VDGASDIAASTTVSATFSEAIDPATLDDISFSVTDTTTTDPVTGTLSYDGPGQTATFTPDADLPAGNGFQANLTTAITDLAGNPLSAPVVWSFNTAVANTAPVANDDSYSTTQDVTLNEAAPGVLGNDTDAEVDPLTAVLDTDVSHGSLTLNADGSFSYTPTLGYGGPDSFTYHAHDGTDDSNVATVSLTVNAIPVSYPAVVRDGTWFLRHGDTSVTVFRYGATSGDIPVFGDWDGDGIATPGVVRAGLWLLRNSNGDGPADLVFRYGATSGDIPVVGDWDGDGIDTPGVVRDGRWFLRNSNSAGPGDLTFLYGKATDIPVVGDWNGDGIDTPGVVRGARWFLRNSNTTGNSDVDFSYGRATDVVRSWASTGG